MTSYASFHRLANAYPAASIWAIGPSEPMKWWEICYAALEAAQDSPGCDPTGSEDDQARYWREALRELQGAKFAMVSVEAEEFAEI